jgi:hypothetical protein
MWSLESVGTFCLCWARSSERLRAAPVVAALLLTGVQPGWADPILIQAGAQPPAGSNADNTSSFPDGLPIKAVGFQDQVFKSTGWPNGGVFTNRSGQVIKDFEITLTSGDTFDPKSSGGTAFPDVTLSDDKKTLTFSGANIPSVPAGQAIKPENQFWLKIPQSADFTDPETGKPGMGKYRGHLTPQPPPPKPAEKSSVPPEAGNSPSEKPKAPTSNLSDSPPAAITYDAASHTFQFSPGAMNFVEYRNGQVVTSNSASESIIGSHISIDPASLIGLSPDIPGAFQLGDSYLLVANDVLSPTKNTFLSGALLQVLLIPESPGSPFDSLLQATISLQEGGFGLGSQFINEFFDPAIDGWQLDFETNLLAATDNLTISGISTGILLMNTTVVPEPSTLMMIGTWLAGLAGFAVMRRRAGITEAERNVI